MQLNNASLPTKALRGHARWLTNANSTTFPDADIDALVNVYYHQLTAKILASMDEWDFAGETATTDLVAGQREYIFPTDILKIKRIDIKLDGTNWTRLNPFDVQEVSEPLASETDIVARFNNESPFYGTLDQSFFVWSGTIITVTSGIKLWYTKEVTELSADTDEPVIEKPFHSMLSEGAALAYFRKFDVDDKVIETQALLDRQEEDLIGFYSRRNEDRVMKFKSLMKKANYR